jgi:hypothetical protein
MACATCSIRGGRVSRRGAREASCHDLALVGRTDPLIADDAIARLHKAGLGLPRALYNAVIAALSAAATAGKALVDDDCAKTAVAELTRDRPRSNRVGRPDSGETIPGGADRDGGAG